MITSLLWKVWGFLYRVVLPFVLNKFVFDFDTVKKEAGNFLRIRAELFSVVVIDQLVPLNSGVIDYVQQVSHYKIDIDTIQKNGSQALRLRIEAFGRVIVDRVLPLKDIIDHYENENVRKMMEDAKKLNKQATKQAVKTLQSNSMFN